MHFPRPQSVYAPNMPLDLLGTAELLVVASLRLWVTPYRDRAAGSPDWRKGFAVAGVGHAGADGFDTLFKTVATAARRGLDVRRPRCGHLGEDEAWLLQLISLLQTGDMSDAAILADWLPPAAVRIALGPARCFAAALAGAGLRISRRHAEAANAQRLTQALYPDRGLALLQ